MYPRSNANAATFSWFLCYQFAENQTSTKLGISIKIGVQISAMNGLIADLILPKGHS
jgi:hypothetical protein